MSVLLFAATAFVAAGCAQNKVPLVYTAPAQNTLPGANAPTVCIVTFADKRPTLAIGQRSDKTEFTAESDVAQWFTQALGTEIARKGVIVTTAASEAEAAKSGAAYIITGSVDEVWITESYMAEYQTRMSSSVLLKKGASTLLSQSFSNNLSRRLVGPSVPRDILSTTVADLATTMASAVYEKIRR